MSLTIGELVLRRRLEQSEQFQTPVYQRGQMHAVIVGEGDGILSYVDDAGSAVQAFCHKIDEHEWALKSPIILKCGPTVGPAAVALPASMRFPDEWQRALENAESKKSKKKQKNT